MNRKALGSNPPGADSLKMETENRPVSPIIRTSFGLLSDTEHVDPALILAFGTGVMGQPHVRDPETTDLIRQGAEGFLREVGKEPAVFLPLFRTVFEGGIEDAAGIQGTVDAAEDVGKVRFAYVQQGSTGPDRVKGICIVQFLKEHMPDGAADALLGEIAQFLAAVHGQHLIAVLGEIKRGFAGAAAEIQNVPARNNLLQETAVMRGHIHVRGAGDKLFSVILIPFQGVVLVHCLFS